MLVEADGVPLDWVLDRIKSENMVPDWGRFWRDARALKWKPETIRSKAEEAVADVYGPEYLRGWQVELERFLAVFEKDVE